MQILRRDDGNCNIGNVLSSHDVSLMRVVKLRKKEHPPDSEILRPANCAQDESSMQFPFIRLKTRSRIGLSEFPYWYYLKCRLHHVFNGLIYGESRVGRLIIDDSQEDTWISTAEEGELSSQSSTHTDVVFRSVRAKPEMDNSKHVFRRLQHVFNVSRLSVAGK